MKYKYPWAVYRDEKGELHKISREELNDPNVLARARSVRLYDETEEYRLYPRARQDSPHFYCRAENPRRLVSNHDPDPRHNVRRDFLLRKLTALAELKVGYREFFASDDWEFVEIAEVEDYVWQREVTRIVPRGLRIRHDLFGASPILAMSERRPWIAIEVIASHYLEEETFQSLLNLSAHLPLLIGFDLVELPNYFVQLDEAKRTLRLVYYIHDGRVWKNHRPQAIYDAATFKAILQRGIRRRDDAA